MNATDAGMKEFDRQVKEMPAGLGRAILRVLGFHVGRDEAIGRFELVDMLDVMGFEVKERQARLSIHELRRKGYLICSAPGEDGGYFLAANMEEFREFCDRELHPKAMDLLETEKAMGEVWGSQPAADDLRRNL